MDSFLNAVARREVDSMASGAIRVRLHKPDISSRLGLTLAQSIYNSHVEVNAIAPNSIASDSGLIKIGQLLYAVNGVQVEDHEEATSLLRASHGMVELTLSRNVIRTEGLTQTLLLSDMEQRGEQLLMQQQAAASRTDDTDTEQRGVQLLMQQQAAAYLALRAAQLAAADADEADDCAAAAGLAPTFHQRSLDPEDSAQPPAPWNWMNYQQSAGRTIHTPDAAGARQ